MNEKAKLHVWKQKDGGVSRCWILPDDISNSAMSFFWFGRYGGGYMPFGRMNQKTRNETILAAMRAREKFGFAVEIFYNAPKDQS